MEKDLFLMILALIISAVFEINLLWIVAVVDTADRLIRLLVYAYIVTGRRRKVKSPSSSAKQNGRLRKRN